jgi:hypothetical protein
MNGSVREHFLSIFTKKSKIYYGEFDSGSELTLAARLKHASRTRTPMLALGGEWRTGE